MQSYYDIACKHFQFLMFVSISKEREEVHVAHVVDYEL